jgi:hypothetical protein
VNFPLLLLLRHVASTFLAGGAGHNQLSCCWRGCDIRMSQQFHLQVVPSVPHGSCFSHLGDPQDGPLLPVTQRPGKACRDLSLDHCVHGVVKPAARGGEVLVDARCVFLEGRESPLNAAKCRETSSPVSRAWPQRLRSPCAVGGACESVSISELSIDPSSTVVHLVQP